MNQPELPFNSFPPFVRGSDTSLQAAERIAPGAGTLRKRVLDHLTKCGGATCDATELALDMRHQTASARIRELYLSGFIVDSGKCLKTRSGRNAVVWKAAP